MTDTLNRLFAVIKQHDGISDKARLARIVADESSLVKDRSVFLFYFVGVDPGKTVKTVLVSMFQRDLLRSTILLRHWSGRNSRGVTQFEGKAIDELIASPNSSISENESVRFLKKVIAL